MKLIIKIFKYIYIYIHNTIVKEFSRKILEFYIIIKMDLNMKDIQLIPL